MLATDVVVVVAVAVVADRHSFSHGISYRTPRCRQCRTMKGPNL